MRSMGGESSIEKGWGIGMESEGVEERVSLILGVAVDEGEMLDS